jgi:ABC-2 type transport system permease protein
MTVAQYAAVGELVLFIFLMSLVGAGELVEARRLGVTRRMLASPTPVRRVIVGEGLGRVLIASLQALLIALLTATLFHVAWGDPLAVTAVIVLFALVSVGAGLLVGTMVHTAEQATSIGPVVGIALGMIGGCMWPLEIVPSGLRAVGHLTPHAWALDGLIKTMGERRHLLDIAPQLGVLAAMALVLVPLAAWRLRHAITSA